MPGGGLSVVIGPERTVASVLAYVATATILPFKIFGALWLVCDQHE
jgi:hypothetical protein